MIDRYALVDNYALACCDTASELLDEFWIIRFPTFEFMVFPQKIKVYILYGLSENASPLYCEGKNKLAR